MPGKGEVEGMGEMEEVAEGELQENMEESGEISVRDGRASRDEEKKGLSDHRNLVNGI
ncbi:hypothetical protein ACFL0G_02000 [Candidatus Zixiibacteriota bacterium]